MLASKYREGIARHPKSVGIVLARLERMPRQAQAVRDLRVRERGPTPSPLQGAAEADHCRGRGIGRIDRMRAFEQGDSLVCALSGVFVKLRQRAQVQVVGIEALSRFPGRALDLGLAELGFDRADNVARHL